MPIINGVLIHNIDRQRYILSSILWIKLNCQKVNPALSYKMNLSFSHCFRQCISSSSPPSSPSIATWECGKIMAHGVKRPGSKFQVYLFSIIITSDLPGGPSSWIRQHGTYSLPPTHTPPRSGHVEGSRYKLFCFSDGDDRRSGLPLYTSPRPSLLILWLTSPLTV